MTTCSFMFGKASVEARRQVLSACILPNKGLKSRASSLSTAPQARDKPRSHRSHEETIAQRDLFVDILSTNVTKRDTRAFLARLEETQRKEDEPATPRKPACPSVNLGALYGPARAIAESPQFIRDHNELEREQVELHCALISIRDAKSLQARTVEGLAITISQLTTLGLNILVVMDSDQGMTQQDIHGQRDAVLQQASDLATAIDEHSLTGARVVMDALIQDVTGVDKLRLVSSKLIFEPLNQGIVTIVPTMAYTTVWKTAQASMASTMAALVDAAKQIHATTDAKLQIDRIIMLEPLGGLPSKVRNEHAHVFVNLEQEYDDIEHELSDMNLPTAQAAVHRNNLSTLNTILSGLPHSSSALIVTPEEAAASSLRSKDTTSALGPGTRKQKNTLIHNLLTNKPLVSSSLPTARFTHLTEAGETRDFTNAPNATLVKKGMPIAIIPRIERETLGWQPPHSCNTLDLETDAQVDLDKLVHLINNSFRRELDIAAYLERIRGRVAGLIIAGDYEGGAILTWETPKTERGASHRPVPYLDKFAVLQSSQGSAGVADIVFQAMVRTCFPHGVCWRSRSNNPVNKWYFERSAGSWKIPDTQWTMFWTGEGIVDDPQRWNDYVDVCKCIVPTWADGKVPD